MRIALRIAGGVFATLLFVGVAAAGTWGTYEKGPCKGQTREMWARFYENPFVANHLAICTRTKGYNGKAPTACRADRIGIIGVWSVTDASCKTNPQGNAISQIGSALDTGAGKIDEASLVVAKNLGVDPTIKLKAEQKLGALSELLLKTVVLSVQAAENGAIKSNVQRKNMPAAKNGFTSLGGFQAVQKDAVSKTTPNDEVFSTISFGLSGSANAVIVGANTETGLAIDFGDDRPAYWYGGAGYKFGPGVSVDGGLTVGLWNAQNNAIKGNSQGFVFGLAELVKAYQVFKGTKTISDAFNFKKGLSVAAAIWFDYSGKFQGVTITPAVSAGFDFGGYAKSGTVQIVN
jgi:hypothetical protein